jgi:hypothetical protein
MFLWLEFPFHIKDFLDIPFMVVIPCRKCGELNYLTPHAFWKISDFGTKCKKCEAINTINAISYFFDRLICFILFYFICLSSYVRRAHFELLIIQRQTEVVRFKEERGPKDDRHNDRYVTAPIKKST